MKIQGLNNILLVDDDPGTNFIHKRTVQKSGIECDIKVCLSAEEGLDYLSPCSASASKEAGRSGIIFLDINMPGLSGWDFLDKYQESESSPGQDMVIVMLTTSLNPEDEKKVKQFPIVKGFYNKPLTVKIINEIVESHFS